MLSIKTETFNAIQKKKKKCLGNWMAFGIVKKIVYIFVTKSILTWNGSHFMMLWEQSYTPGSVGCFFYSL